MQKRRLGRTDIWVSTLGLGTVKFGRNQGVKYPSHFELPSDKTIVHLLSLAKDNGINLLDTAPAYGNSEERIGKLLSNRKDWIICTKVGEIFENGLSYFDFSKEAISKSIETSLLKLKTDYLDCVLIHSDGQDKKHIEEGVFESCQQLKKEGKLLSFGMSTKTNIGTALASRLSDVIMIEAINELIELASQHSVGILIKKALQSGHLPLHDDEAVANKLHSVLRFEKVSSIIIGTINPNHLQQNIANMKTL